MKHFIALLSRGWPALPLAFMLSYIAATYAVFLWGAIPWHIGQPALLNLYIACCVAALAIGYALSDRKKSSGNTLFSWRFFFWIGGVSSLLLLAPTAFLATHKWPWEVWSAALDQNQAYLDMLAVANDLRFGLLRKVIAVLGLLAAPFIFSVIPLGVIYWSNLRASEVALLYSHVLSIFILSILRGTDKEIGDLICVLLALLPMVVCRAVFRCGMTWRGCIHFTIICIVSLTLSVSIFMMRKYQRLAQDGGLHNIQQIVERGGFVPKFSYEGTLDVSTRSKVVKVVASSYLSQGYYGLSLALQHDFTSCYGLGHSPLLLYAVGERIKPGFSHCSYIEKISKDGWDQRFFWASVMTWLANDVGFTGALFVLGACGFLLAKSWREALAEGDDRAVMVFLLLMTAGFYFPANNQVMLTPASYVTVMFWLGYWLIMKYRDRLAQI